MKKAGVVVAALLAAGCGKGALGHDQVNPEVPSWYHRPAMALDVVIHRELTVGGRQMGEDWERGKPEIDAEHGRVFVGSSDHGLYAIRAGDGSTLWRYETGGMVQSEPLYDPDLDVVYFGSNDGAMYCVRASSGALVYRFDAGAEVSRKPVRLGETVVLANASDFIFAIDRRTGKPRWQAHRTPALGMEISGHAGPALDASTGTVFFAYSDGHVGAYAIADGAEKWAPVDLSAEAEQSGADAARYLDVDTTPVVDEHPNVHVIYVASYAGGVYALDAATGSRVWANEKALGVTDLSLFNEPAHKPNPNGPGAGGPTVPGKKLVIASSAQSGLMGLDPYTGRAVWRNKVPEGGVTAPVAMGGALLVGTTRYGLFLLSPRNGRVIDAIDLGTGFSATPAAAGERAFALSNGGSFLGFAVQAPLAHRGAKAPADMPTYEGPATGWNAEQQVAVPQRGWYTP